MPFSPLPRSLLDRLTAIGRAGGVAVELGCGDGRCAELFRPLGVDLIGLDSTGPELGTTARIVGDALRPPLAPGSLSLLVAANVVRHLLPADPQARFLQCWRSLLSPSGWLLILEDEPTLERAASRNYAAWQDVLRRLAAGRRGPLLPLASFRALLPRTQRALWSCGRQRNRYPLQVARVLELIDRGGPAAGAADACGPLRAAIIADGMDYGDYWWALCPGCNEEI